MQYPVAQLTRASTRLLYFLHVYICITKILLVYIYMQYLINYVVSSDCYVVYMYRCHQTRMYIMLTMCIIIRDTLPNGRYSQDSFFRSLASALRRLFPGAYFIYNLGVFYPGDSLYISIQCCVIQQLQCYVYICMLLDCMQLLDMCSCVTCSIKYMYIVSHNHVISMYVLSNNWYIYSIPTMCIVKCSNQAPSVCISCLLACYVVDIYVVPINTCEVAACSVNYIYVLQLPSSMYSCKKHVAYVGQLPVRLSIYMYGN